MRYQNPHGQYRPSPQQMQQQQFMQQQQQMTPTQMASLQQQYQQQLQQMNPMQMQQMMAMMQQQQQMQQMQQMGNQFGMQQQGNYQANNRFGSPQPQQQFQQNNHQVNTQGMFQKNNQSSNDFQQADSRYGTKQGPKPMTNQVLEQEQEVQEAPVTKPTKQLQFTDLVSYPLGDDTYEFPVRSASVKPEDFEVRDAKLVILEPLGHLDAVIGDDKDILDVTPEFKFELTELISVEEFVKTKTTKSFLNALGADVSRFYKEFKKIISTCKQPQQVAYYSRINKYITDELNRFLALEYEEYGISIDSFVTDFNELAKALRVLDNCDDIVDAIYTNVQVIMDDLEEALGGMNPEYLENKEPVCFAVRKISLCYSDYSYTLGLGEVTDRVKVYEDNKSNTLTTLVESVHALTERYDFIVTTLNANTYRFTRNTKGELFVEKV